MPHVGTAGIRALAVLAIVVCGLSAGASSTALAGANATGDEVPGFENEYTKIVRNADGTFTAEIHSAPINYRDAAGAWRAIDPTLVPAPAGGWQNAAGPDAVAFAASASPL